MDSGEWDENHWKEVIVAMSTHPQHLYRLCEFCGGEIPRSCFDDHTATCPGYQLQFADTSAMMTAQESDKNSSSVLVIGRVSRESSRSRQPTSGDNMAYIAPDEEYNPLVEIQLPTAVQVTNNHASSRLVVGTSILSSNEFSLRLSTVYIDPSGYTKKPCYMNYLKQLSQDKL